MNAKCSICFDSVGSTPLSTRCGHLYCPDCAIFNFNSTDRPLCAICRTPQTYPDLIQLFPDLSEVSPPQSPQVAAEDDNSLLKLSLETLNHLNGEEWSVDRVDSHLLEIQDGINDLEHLGDSSDVRPLLKTVGKGLEAIRARVEEIRATQLVLLQQNEVAAKRAELLTREVDLRKQKSVHEELMVQQQERHHIALEDLRDKVRRAYGDLDRVQVQRDVASEHARSLEWNVRELKETLDATNTELDRLRADLSNSRGKEAKYRSKYHALRSKVHDTKRMALGKSRAHGDDELVVLPPEA